jgi:hypothetical protein
MNAHHITGGCHCGNVSFVFEASAPLDQLGLRACQCTFCRAHAARMTSDPQGTFALQVRDDGKLQRYRFGQNTADFLICRECGAFIGALMEESGKPYHGQRQHLPTAAALRYPGRGARFRRRGRF